MGHAIWPTLAKLPAVRIERVAELYKKIINNKKQSYKLEQLRLVSPHANEWPSYGEIIYKV